MKSSRLFSHHLSRFSVALLFISFIPLYSAADSPNSPLVIELTDDNFYDSVSDGLWIIKFVAPWCGHCKRLTPEYNEAATIASKDSTISSIFHFGSIDVTKNNKLRTEFAVFSFPTLKLFSKGQYVKDYTGGRSSTSLVQFAKSISSFSVQTLEWNSEILKTIVDQLTHHHTLQSPPTMTPPPVSAFALRCGLNDCDESFSIFHTIALEFFDHSSFLHVQVPEGADVSTAPVVIALSHDNSDKSIELSSPITLESLRDFVIQHQWPGVVALDFMRFHGIKQNTKLAKAFGLVALAADPNDDQLERYITRIEKAAKHPELGAQFRFGWMDGVRAFRRGFNELGIDRLPRIVVFGSVNPKAIWMSPEVNLTRLEDSLFGILDSSIQPMSGIDEKRKMLAIVRGVFDDLYIFSSQSLWNLALVLGLTFTSVTIFFCACYFFVLEFRSKDDIIDTRQEQPILDDQRTDSTDEGTLRTFPESPKSELKNRRENEDLPTTTIEKEFQLEESEEKKIK